MRTGRTMALAIGAVRSMKAGRVIAAAPVGSRSAVAQVGVATLHCVATPASSAMSPWPIDASTCLDEADRQPARAAGPCTRRFAEQCAKSDGHGSVSVDIRNGEATRGNAFDLELPDGTSVAMKLEEVLLFETRQRRPSRGHAPRRVPFSMFFAGPVSPILPQAIYTFRARGRPSRNSSSSPSVRTARRPSTRRSSRSSRHQTSRLRQPVFHSRKWYTPLVSTWRNPRRS